MTGTHNIGVNKNDGTQVEVGLRQRPKHLGGTYYFEVFVPSIIKPGVQSLGIHEFGPGSNQREEIGQLAALLAEERCMKHNDMCEPGQMAEDARQLYDELMKDPNVESKILEGGQLPRDADRIIRKG